jgi:hypothetical protein
MRKNELTFGNTHLPDEPLQLIRLCDRPTIDNGGKGTVGISTSRELAKQFGIVCKPRSKTRLNLRRVRNDNNLSFRRFNTSA